MTALDKAHGRAVYGRASGDEIVGAHAQPDVVVGIRLRRSPGDEIGD
jgi:hypothetical protein